MRAATALRRTLAGLLLVLAVLGPAAAAGAAPASRPPAPAPGHPWFGPALDINRDGPTDYADRLGANPSLYTFPVGYPLSKDGTDQLDDFAADAATQGAALVLEVDPRVQLQNLRQSDADALADLLVELHRKYDTYTLVRFAPEMNGSWRTWGQQPAAFVDAFRTVATTVHAATRFAAMVWSPVYGSGYPFGLKQGADSAIDLSRQREVAPLDTNGDGRVDIGDDPYGPYYPGDDAVDWVGLFLYRFGQSQGLDRNVVPPPGEVEARLHETWGYPGRNTRAPFYDRFAQGHDKPMLLETSALYNPAVGGASELRLKRTWWREVLDALPSHPLIGAISWLELRRAEAEVGDQVVDWRATVAPQLAAALLADLRDSDVSLDPVTDVHDQQQANEATAQGRIPPVDQLGDSMGWVVIGVVFLALLFLVSGAVGRWVPSWRYRDDGGSSRDLRIDLFRGFLICTVVITHTEVAGALSYFTLNAFGAISGAEGFVMLSGVVLGMVHASQAARLGEWPAAVLRLRRARKIYLVALVVTVLVYVAGKVPGIDATVVTTFTDRGTGAAGAAAKGQVYDLYVNARHLFDYPPPWFAVRELLTLHMGPWVLNVLGLFVVMTALAPLFMWLLLRRMWWLVLAISWAGYVYGRVADVHWLPSQFEDVFPLLIWQLVFVHGLVIGFYRTQLVAALTSRWGKIACAVAVTAYAAVLGVLWLVHRDLVPAGPFDPGTYATLYDRFYIRVDLQPGRLLDLALVAVVVFAFLTTFWRPVHGAVGRFLVPLGQASLYVFIVHVVLVIGVDNVPGLDRTSSWQGLLVHVVELALVWLLVRYRVLFSVIPR